MEKHTRLRALRAAFPETIPILTGFSFLGFTYGLYTNVQGFSFVYPMVMAAVIFGGSLEFVTVTLLLSPFAPLSAFVIALLVQARHLFYGLAMLKKYDKSLGLKRIALIYGLCDETFAINYTAKIPAGVDRGWFYFFITLLDYLYWVVSATLGGLLGAALPFDLTGIGFVMTAMFVVIFLSQLETEQKAGHSLAPAWVGFGAAILCLLAFGPDRFLLPTMGLMLALLLLLRPRLERRRQK